MKTFIKLENVDVDLPVGGKPLAGLFQRNPQTPQAGRVDQQKRGGYVRALQNISIDISPGEKLGLVGVNGAGKSTMLKVLAGIYAPTRGTYEARGKVSTLFSSVVGMNQNASGRENIFVSGRTLGMSRNQIASVEEDIIEFAELGEFIDLPIRLYSSGMKTRLGFAIATAIDPEILLIDEVFGVGDSAFRERANERIMRVVGQAGILVLATHADAMITKFCERVCWIDDGKAKFIGEAEEGLALYKEAAKRRQNRK